MVLMVNSVIKAMIENIFLLIDCRVPYQIPRSTSFSEYTVSEDALPSPVARCSVCNLLISMSVEAYVVIGIIGISKIYKILNTNSSFEKKLLIIILSPLCFIETGIIMPVSNQSNVS